jgi:uncharacterized protein (DUF433 family)
MLSIEEKEGICGGQPVLAGTRIEMSHFQELVEAGWSYERILSEYPHLDRLMFLDAMGKWMHQTNWRDNL